MINSKLKSCPFCGSREDLFTHMKSWYVGCSACGIDGPWNDIEDDEEAIREAHRAWNARYSPMSDYVVIIEGKTYDILPWENVIRTPCPSCNGTNPISSFRVGEGICVCPCLLQKEAAETYILKEREYETV